MKITRWLIILGNIWFLARYFGIPGVVWGNINTMSGIGLRVLTILFMVYEIRKDIHSE